MNMEALASADEIRQLRKELGSTQEQFAEIMGVEPRTVQRWESGETRPRSEHMMKMLELKKKLYVTKEQTVKLNVEAQPVQHYEKGYRQPLDEPSGGGGGSNGGCPPPPYEADDL